MKWRDTNEMWEAIQKARARLLSPGGNVEVARAEAQYFSAMTRILAFALEHAKLTRRLRRGTSVMPSVRFDGEVIDIKARSADVAVAVPAKPKRKALVPCNRRYASGS